MFSSANYENKQSEARFMIDISAFQKMHPKSRTILDVKNPNDVLKPEEANAEDPPSGNFLLLLPSNIYGFHMQDKKWSMSFTRQVS
jgi:hypothetical protein